MSAIADIFASVRLQLDTGQFQTDAVSAANSAGKSAGQTMGEQLGSKLRSAMGSAIGAGAGALFGIAIQQGAALDAATQKLAADTGLTGQALAQQSSAIDSMYRGNLQSMDSVEASLAEVISGFNLSGQAADDLTQKMLTYETATGQDAQAVTALKMITDAWNLSASDEGTIMDQLVASHQKYGTSVADDQTSLQKMAPALTAMGMQFSDGVDLLNMFAAAGIDASKAPTALNTAIKQLKPGQTLNDLITQISSIQDPLERAKVAAKDFGTRAGAQLADALKPGITSLDQFQTSTVDTQDATQKAADAIRSDWGNQFTLLMHNIGGALASVSQSFGPLLIIGAQMTPKIAAGFGGLAGAIIPKIAEQLGLTLPTWLGGGAAAGGATVTGEAGAVAAGGPAVAAAVVAQSPEIDAAAGASGLEAGGAMATAEAGAVTAGGAEVAVAAGGVGTLAGGALAVALPLALMVGLAAAAPTIQDWLNKNLNLNSMLFGSGGGPLAGIGDWANNLPWPLGPKNTPTIDLGPFKNILGGTPAPTVPDYGATFSGSATALAGQQPAITAAATEAYSGIAPAATDAAAGATDALAQGTDAQVGLIKTARTALSGAWTEAMNNVVAAQTIGYREQDAKAALDATQKQVNNKATYAKLTATQKDALQTQLITQKAAYLTLLEEDTQYGTDAQKATKMQALLQSQALKDGLASMDPDTVTMWQAVQSDTEQALATLNGTVSTGGTAAGTAYSAGFLAGIANGKWATALLNSPSLVTPPPGSVASWSTPGGTVSSTSSAKVPVTPGPKPRAAVKAFASGTVYVDSDQLAFIHKGEAVIPASQNTGGFGGVTIGTIQLTLEGNPDRAAAKRFAVMVHDEIAAEMQKQNSRFSSYSGIRP
jgi:hypothetical protein